jgi:hypothetical protein
MYIEQYTLILDIVDILVKIFDVSKEVFHIKEINIHQYQVRDTASENNNKIVFKITITIIIGIT